MSDKNSPDEKPRLLDDAALDDVSGGAVALTEAEKAAIYGDKAVEKPVPIPEGGIGPTIGGIPLYDFIKAGARPSD